MNDPSDKTENGCVTPKTKKSVTTHLRFLHRALCLDLVRFQKNLPADTEALTEDFERYARVIMLLIRAMDMLIQREQSLLDDLPGDQKSKEDIIAELERAFDRINAATPASGNFEQPQ